MLEVRILITGKLGKTKSVRHHHKNIERRMIVAICMVDSECERWKRVRTYFASKAARHLR